MSAIEKLLAHYEKWRIAESISRDAMPIMAEARIELRALKYDIATLKRELKQAQRQRDKAIDDYIRVKDELNNERKAIKETL